MFSDVKIVVFAVCSYSISDISSVNFSVLFLYQNRLDRVTRLLRCFLAHLSNNMQCECRQLIDFQSTFDCLLYSSLRFETTQIGLAVSSANDRIADDLNGQNMLQLITDLFQVLSDEQITEIQPAETLPILQLNSSRNFDQSIFGRIDSIVMQHAIPAPPPPPSEQVLSNSSILHSSNKLARKLKVITGSNPLKLHSSPHVNHAELCYSRSKR